MTLLGATQRRAEELFQAHRLEVVVRTDRLFAGLLAVEWIVGIAAALWISPRTWAGESFSPHIHVWAAIFLGGASALLPIILALSRPGAPLTRHTIAVGQMLMASLAIHLTGGRIETHFLIFGSLAFLAFYRDWRVLISASLVVALDHWLRGVYLPQSVYGVFVASAWRWAEHAGWVIFEDVFLVVSCIQGSREMWDIAQKRAQLESTKELVEGAVIERTGELRASEERFRSLSSSAPVGIFLTDPQGRCLYANAKWERISGQPLEATLGEGWTKIIHPDDLRVVTDSWSRAVGSGGDFSLEYRIVTPDGVKWIHVLSAPLRSDIGEITGYAGTVEDITQRKMADEERARLIGQIEQQRTRLNNIVENVAGVVWEAHGHPNSPEQQFTFVSKYAEKMLGYEVARWLSSPNFWLEIVHSEDRERIETEARAIYENAREGALAFRWLASDGRVVWVEMHLVVMFDAADRPYGLRGIAIDVSEHRQLETQLERAHRLSSLGRLAATIAHEINNVLMGIQPFAEIIQRRTADQPDLHKAGTHIIRSIQRGKRITQEILRFTQPNVPVFKSIVLANWVKEFLPELQSLLGDGIDIEISIPQKSLCVTADPAQLQQILSNLAVNARDAMGHHGKFTFGIERAHGNGVYAFGHVPDIGRFVHLTIGDSGYGMSEETMRHVFEPLFTTKKSGGTGLGLAIAHQVIEGHGGHIFVESKLGIGTTFHLFLPFDQQQEPSVDPIEEISSHVSIKRLLLVEDEASVSAGIEAILGMSGVDVRTVDRGAKAMMAIENFDPEVVVLDVGLPDMDGVDVYRQIAQRWPRLPVIFSTGHGDQSKIQKELSMPHVGYLLKPYDSDTLLRSIESVVETV